MGLFGKSMREKEEEYMRRINVSECLKQDFRMRIDDTFTLIGTRTCGNRIKRDKERTAEHRRCPDHQEWE